MDNPDGFEAVQKARELEPDLILLDVSLPTWNGINVAKAEQGLARLQDSLLGRKLHA